MFAKYTHTTLYIINNLVDFYPADRCLTNRITGKSVTLQSPASFILLYLLTHDGVVIAQRTLMTAGWGDKSSVTSSNTFYQTVLTLRNALTEVGLPRDLIKTVARRGMMISADIHCPENISSGTETKLAVSTEKSMPALAKGDFSRGMWMRGALLLLMLIGTGTSVGMFFPTTESLFSSYTIVDAASVSSCTILLKGKEALNTRYNEFLRKHPNLCQNHNYVYLSGMHSAKNISAVACQMDIKKVPTTKCTTWYSINNEN